MKIKSGYISLYFGEERKHRYKYVNERHRKRIIENWWSEHPKQMPTAAVQINPDIHEEPKKYKKRQKNSVLA